MTDDGCRFMGYVDDYAQCHCNHLTHFALLMVSRSNTSDLNEPAGSNRSVWRTSAGRTIHHSFDFLVTRSGTDSSNLVEIGRIHPDLRHVHRYGTVNLWSADDNHHLHTVPVMSMSDLLE